MFITKSCKYYNDNHKLKIKNGILERLQIFVRNEKNKFLTINEIKKAHEKEYNLNQRDILDLSRSSYYRMLTNKKYLNMSYKKVSANKLYIDNSDNNKIQRNRFVQIIVYYISLGFQIIFLDESGFSLISKMIMVGNTKIKNLYQKKRLRNSLIIHYYRQLILKKLYILKFLKGLYDHRIFLILYYA